MRGDRRLWSLGGLSALATLIVLLGASGSGADITRAAAAVLGRAPASQAAPATAPADSARTTTSDDSTRDGAAATTAAATDPGTTAVTDAASDDTSDDSTEVDAGGGGGGGSGPDSTPAATTPTSNIRHVFLITLAAKGLDATFGAGSPANYLTGELRPKGVLLSGFRSLGGAAVADRIAAVSGQPPNAATRAGCTTYSQIPPLTTPDKAGVIAQDGCVYPNTVVTIGEQIQGARLQWKAYAEDLDQGPRGAAATCRRPTLDQQDDTLEPRPGDTYTARNVPWVYFRASIDVANCDTGVVPLSRLSADLSAVKSTPNLVYVAPGLCSDGSREACSDGAPGGLAAADAFLRRTVPGILASPAYRQDGLLVITFAGAPGGGDDANGTLLLSPYLTGGGTVDRAADPYTLLRTFEEIFGIQKYLAKAAGATSLTADALAGARPVQPGDD